MTTIPPCAGCRLMIGKPLDSGLRYCDALKVWVWPTTRKVEPKYKLTDPDVACVHRNPRRRPALG